MPPSFSMKAFTRRSCGSQSCVPSSEQESCTMCSSSTPCWSATEAMQSLSQFELRKLGVMTENFMAGLALVLGSDGRSRQWFAMFVEPGRQFPLAGYFAAKNGQNQIVSHNGVEWWRIGDGFVCSGRFDDEWHTHVIFAE